MKIGEYFIQLMHSLEVNIRICQPENSDVHRGELNMMKIWEYIIQLMHSFEVNIRICQPKNSDVH